MARFEEIPLIDNHLHPPLTQALVDALLPAAFFTEAHGADLLTVHAPHLPFLRRAVRDLAGLLGCGPSLDEVTAARRALGPAAMLRLCIKRANVVGLIVDDGYPPAGIGMTPKQMGEAGDCSIGRVLRLETLAGELAAQHAELRRFDRALLDGLEQARASGTVALKTIIAYRCGLAFELPQAREAAAAIYQERTRATDGPLRLTDPRLLYHTLALALEWAGDHGVPVQIHSGFGDRDLHLAKANPALLKPLLEESRFNRAPLVLLHAGYPYSREAGYLAGVYPRVFVDWSEANPLLAGPVLVRTVEELLALAPVTKLLYGSDAWGVPDWIWLGSVYGREALATALGTGPDAESDARRILHDNAAELYGLV
jgi:uncharacterized protein